MPVMTNITIHALKHKILQTDLHMFGQFLHSLHDKHFINRSPKKQMQLISTSNKIINLNTIYAIVYAFKSADDSSVNSSVKLKATNPKDNKRKKDLKSYFACFYNLIIKYSFIVWS